MVGTARGAGLVDQFGRRVHDVRISITDRCDFSCTYCMPTPVETAANDELLTVDELARLAWIFVRDFSVPSIRLTGGEPTVRRDVVDIVEAIAATGVTDLSMTTHGARLTHLAVPLANAGLHRLNVSLDTLDEHRYEQVTRRRRLAEVLAGLRVARDAGLWPIKLNAVLTAGPEVATDVCALVEFAAAEGFAVRFIEYMPLDSAGQWTSSSVVPGRVVREVLEAAGWVWVDPGLDGASERGSAPAEMTWATRGNDAVHVGVIASVNQPFCSACDRVRITADGAVRSCLFSHDEVDLRAALRGGAADHDVAALIRDAVWRKPEAHGVGTPTFIQPRRAMSRIGG